MRQLFPSNLPFAIAIWLFVFFSAPSAMADDPLNTESAPAETNFQLLLIDLDSCASCKAWKRNNHTAYLESELNDLAPLTNIEVRSLDESDFFYIERPTVFPTFVLLDSDKQELDRIQGYTTDDFWWGYVDTVFRKHNVL